MKTKFEKIYVVSLITNKDRQKFIKEQFDDLGIEFEFIYGIDFVNFEGIDWVDLSKDVYLSNGDKRFTTTHVFGCGMSHYQAVNQTYHLGYNNVLIIEDDVCMNKDKQMLEEVFNNIPECADYITYDIRPKTEFAKKYLDKIFFNTETLYQNMLAFELWGGAMYGIMNRKTMELYLNNQHKHFTLADAVDGIWHAPGPTLNRYLCKKCVYIDQYTYEKSFVRNNDKFVIGYTSVSFTSDLNKYKNKDDFYCPPKFDIFTNKDFYVNEV